MATINTSGALDGTTVNSNLTLTVQSRSATKVVFAYTIKTHLNASGSTDAGYEIYTGVIAVSGTSITSKSETITLKPLSEGWSGSTEHTKTGTFEVSTSSPANLTANITYTVSSSRDSTNHNTGTTTIQTGSGEVAPSAPTNLQFNKSQYTFKDTITASWTKPSGNVTGYNVSYRVNGGSWVSLGTTTSTSKTITNILKFRQTIQFKVSAYNAAGTSPEATSSTAVCVGGILQKVNGTYSAGEAYVKVNGTWKRGIVYIKQNGTWGISK